MTKETTSWTHNICYDCWHKEHEADDIPVRVRDCEPKQCCYCGRWTMEGIFVRDDPKMMKCGCQDND
jgi:hypothetical protein